MMLKRDEVKLVDKPKVGIVGEILIKYHHFGNNFVIDLLEKEILEMLEYVTLFRNKLHDINCGKEFEIITDIDNELLFNLLKLNDKKVENSKYNDSVRVNLLDLMSKLSGMRNGYLEGVPVTIPAGTNIREVIISTLALGGFTRYVCEEAPEPGVVPMDLNFNQGTTVYNMLSTLKDIYPNDELFTLSITIFSISKELYDTSLGELVTGAEIKAELSDSQLTSTLTNNNNTRCFFI